MDTSIIVDGTGEPLPVRIYAYGGPYTEHAVMVGPVRYTFRDLAAVCDLLDRLRIEADARLLDQQGRPHLPGWAPDELRTGAVLAEARAADPTRRLRTLRDREQIAELTAEEYEADARGERLADAIAAEDGAA